MTGDRNATILPLSGSDTFLVEALDSMATNTRNSCDRSSQENVCAFCGNIFHCVCEKLLLFGRSIRSLRSDELLIDVRVTGGTAEKRLSEPHSYII